MAVKKGWIFAASFLLAAATASVPGPHAETGESRLVPWRVERDALRFRAVATDVVMETLAIRPGMTILDIGAGTGQFAFEFARRLDGTGTVYATDTNAYCIDNMKKEAGRRGLFNLRPVLVARNGFDDFYEKHRYDLVTIFHVAMPYEERVDHLRRLRERLTASGRLVLILYDIPAAFSPDDFTGDFREFTAALAREPAGGPFSGILSEPTKKRVREPGGAGDERDLRKAIAGDFNAFLQKTDLAARFADESVFEKETSLSPEERRYADWMLLPFRKGAVRVGDPGAGKRADARTSATINKILVVQRYRRFLKKDGLFLPGLTSPIRDAFAKAGYRLERECRDLIPFEDLAVYSPR